MIRGRNISIKIPSRGEGNGVELMESGGCDASSSIRTGKWGCMENASRALYMYCILVLEGHSAVHCLYMDWVVSR